MMAYSTGVEMINCHLCLNVRFEQNYLSCDQFVNNKTIPFFKPQKIPNNWWLKCLFDFFKNRVIFHINFIEQHIYIHKIFCHLSWFYSSQTFYLSLQRTAEESPYDVVANMLDCVIIVTSKSSHSILFTFRLISLGKVSTPLLLMLWVK